MTTTDLPVQPRLKRALGPTALILFGLTYLAPVTVFTTYGIVTESTDNHLPSAYVVALVAMLFTALSYGAMARAFPVSGSAYTYTQQSFGGHVGFLTGWTLMLDYLFLPMINFLLIGLYLNTQFPEVPQWVFALASLLLVLVFNVLGITLVNKLNVAIVALSVLLVVVFAVLAIKELATNPSADTPSLIEPFLPGSGGLGPVFAGAAVLALSFLGFDAVSTLSEEAKNPKRDIPRAIMLTTLIGGAIFIVVSWLGALVFPDWRDFANVDSAGVDLMAKVGGTFLTSFFVAVYVVGAFGSGMTTQVSVSRIIYSMGRDRVLPGIFGKLHSRFHTPWVAAIAVSIVSLLSLVLTLDVAATMISFGALAAFSMVNLSVIRHHLFPKGGREKPSAGEWIRYGLLPAIGFLLTVWLWTSLTVTTFIVGLSWVALGVIYLAVLTRGFRRKPPMMDFSEKEAVAAEA
ncbi:APC family permease [Leifsonia aquatica]|uniref:Amino acid permease n=2 Tax=Leifsonia aquatica TaxID=144185 RepID=U2RV70_LEIAQ|nr:APC family permease [Leifsonia aquatica]ERK72676.1 amino acid permease [Leifsonia aquatica ATCC 14665]MBB2968829.1 amino acid transporter [Leifsonia aquatica]